jgi:hypothetical protein
MRFAMTMKQYKVSQYWRDDEPILFKKNAEHLGAEGRR